MLFLRYSNNIHYQSDNFFFGRIHSFYYFSDKSNILAVWLVINSSNSHSCFKKIILFHMCNFFQFGIFPGFVFNPA